MVEGEVLMVVESEGTKARLQATEKATGNVPV